MAKEIHIESISQPQFNVGCCLEGVRTNVNLEIYMSDDFEYLFAQMLPNSSLSFSTNHATNKLATPGSDVLS